MSNISWSQCVIYVTLINTLTSHQLEKIPNIYANRSKLLGLEAKLFEINQTFKIKS